MLKKYQIILADPPWRQSKGGKKAVRKNSSGTSLEYPVLSINQIRDILFKACLLGDNNHVFFLWTIDKYLWEAEDILKTLGYKLHARLLQLDSDISIYYLHIKKNFYQ